MKFKALPFVIAVLTAAAAHAQTTTVVGDVNITPGVPANPGNVSVAGDATVNGTLTVQAAPSPVTVTSNSNSAGQQNAVTGTDDGTSTAVRTVLGGAQADYTTATGGGAVIENNGDTTLNSSTGSNNSVSVSRVTEVRVYNADQGVNAGQPVPGTQSYYLIDANGVEILGSRVSVGDPGVPDAATAQANFEELIDGDGVGDIDFTSAAFDSARTSTPLANTGGNLSVGGNATIAGQTTTNGIDNSGEKITGVADGTAASDAVNKGQLDAEATARANADTALQNNIDTEAATRAAEDTLIRDEFRAADTALQNNINAEAATRASEDAHIRNEFRTADTALQNNIDAEAATRASEDAHIRNEFRTADANIIADYTQKIDAEESARIFNDNQIRDEFRAADADIRNEFRAADRKLKRAIDKNTRGIAMVAAMTNTRVEAGKTHGVDFNISQFSSSTGFAFGYANRINDKVQLQAALASSEDFEEAVGRIGVSVQW
ncbi:MAG: hypothetical protein QM627_02565 [Luteolibacter sp.]